MLCTLDCTGVAALDHNYWPNDPSVILESTRPGNKARPAPRPKDGFQGSTITYFDVSPHAKSHKQSSLSKCYRKLEDGLTNSVSEKLALLLHTPPLQEVDYGK